MLIVFEGIDGSGKSSVIDVVYEKLKRNGNDVVRLKEPSLGPFGQKFRRISTKPMQPGFANSLLIKDRFWDVSKNIAPALKHGKIVLLDRYYYSHVYQAKDIEEAWRVITFNRRRFPLPAITLLFDVSPLVAKRRILASRKRMEALERRLPDTRNLYKHLSRYPEVRRVNATPSLDVVVERAYELISEKIRRRSGSHDR